MRTTSRILLLLGLGLAVAHVAASPAAAARGRDLVAGYEWFDIADGAVTGPGFFDGTPAVLNPADNAAPTFVPLPWPFPFHGVDRGGFWISDNGWIAFTDPGIDSAPIAGSLPSTLTPQAIVAPFWTDLDCSNAAFGFGLRHGTVSSAGAYRVQFYGVKLDAGQITIVDLYLYQDGRIKFQYGAPTSFDAATIGIENDAGDDGFSIVAGGVPSAGVVSPVASGHVFDILPPPILATECTSATPLSCGVLDASLPGAMPKNIIRYGCSSQDHMAREQVHAVTLASAGRLRVALTPGTGTNLRMVLVESCSERACIAGPVTAFDSLLGAGTYHILVDAPSVADEGTYTLQVECLPLGAPLACGDSVSGDTTGGSRLVSGIPCAGALDLSGPEAMYVIDLAAEPLLRASLVSMTAELDLLLLSVPATGPITASDCLQWGGTSILLGSLPPGQYLLIVDGVTGASGTFSLETSCAIEADCASIAGIVDFGGGVRQALAGDTSTGASALDVVGCDLQGLHDGKELVYQIVLPADGQVAILDPAAGSGRHFFILDACDETTCAGALSGSCGVTLAAGTHYLVADSDAGAEGPFAIELVFDAVFNRWSECEDPNLGTLVGDVVKTVWEFNDGAYCISAPESHNHPDGCTFAMYATVNCGTEFHIPLFDVESGHVRVQDVFRGEYVQLTALSETGWTVSGDDIWWEDCTGIADSWNEVTTDISFRRPEGACGVYRLEFINHSGFVWSLFANCTGESVGGYPIFDSLCGAVAAFDPLPNLSLVTASASVTCPDISVTYEIVNDGCADASNVEVSLLDDGVVVAVDVIPVLAGSSRLTRTLNATFPGGASTANVSLRVDASDRIVECEEVPGSGCALGAGVDSLGVANCAGGCAIVAAASAQPSTICPGGLASIDASASASTDCPGGVLEYELTGPGGIIAPWQSAPVFADLAPTDSTDYEVAVRCADPALAATCVDTTMVSVVVDAAGSDPSLLPIVGGTLRVGWPDACSQAVVPLRWGSDSPLDVAAGEHFHVLRAANPATDPFVQINVPDPPLLQAAAFSDAAADQPDTGRALWCYLACVANACHADNRLLDPSAP